MRSGQHAVAALRTGGRVGRAVPAPRAVSAGLFRLCPEGLWLCWVRGHSHYRVQRVGAASPAGVWVMGGQGSSGVMVRMACHTSSGSDFLAMSHHQLSSSEWQECISQAWGSSLNPGVRASAPRVGSEGGWIHSPCPAPRVASRPGAPGL